MPAIGLLLVASALAHPTASAAQERGDDLAARELAATGPSTEISGFGPVSWGTPEAEIVAAYGDPSETRILESGLHMLAYRDSLAGQPSLLLFGLLPGEGLVKAQEVVDVPGGEACIELIRDIHQQINLQYPLIRPAEQAKNNSPDTICEAAPRGEAYWHRQWRDAATGSVVTVSLPSGSAQIDVTFESGRFREWIEPEESGGETVLEDEGAASEEVLEASP